MVLECKLHQYSKIQLLHHNQDQLVAVDLVLLDILMVVLGSSSLVEVEEVLPKLTDLMVMMVVHTYFLQLLIQQIQMHRSLVVVEEDIILEMQQVLYKTLVVAVVVDKEVQDLPLEEMVVPVSFLSHILLDK